MTKYPENDPSIYSSHYYDMNSPESFETYDQAYQKAKKNIFNS